MEAAIVESGEMVTGLLLIAGYIVIGMTCFGLIGLLSWYLKRSWDV